MKRVLGRRTIGTLAATLFAGAVGLAQAGPLDSAKTTLPEQTVTHFFEIYHCGELAGVVWVTPGEAATFRTPSLRSPGVGHAALKARSEAVEEGTAFAVHGKKGGCSDA